MQRWELLELDFQEVYGLDLVNGDSDLMRRRSWRWFRVRVLGLLSTESRLQRVLNPQSPPETGKQ
jgi:hypothetical protein